MRGRSLKASHLWVSVLKHRTGTTFTHRHTSERACSTITVGVLTLIQFVLACAVPVPVLQCCLFRLYTHALCQCLCCCAVLGFSSADPRCQKSAPKICLTQLFINCVKKRCQKRACKRVDTIARSPSSAFQRQYFTAYLSTQINQEPQAQHDTDQHSSSS